MKIRPASAPSLADAMEQLAEVRDRAELLAYLREHYPFWGPTDENVTSQWYAFDGRTGWNTHLISVAGNAALFSDGWFDDGTEPGAVGVIPLAFAESDARKAAAGEPHSFAWRCLTCQHEWGSMPILAYADPAWCPACQAAENKRP